MAELYKDDINAQVQKIKAKLESLSRQLGKDTQGIKFFRQAGKLVVDRMKANAKGVRNNKYSTGRLKESISLMAFRKAKNFVFVGPQYYQKYDKEGNPRNVTARHAHLVEFGYVSKKGNKVPGNPFVKKTYNQTRYTVLAALQKEVIKLTKKAERINAETRAARL